MNAIYLWFLPEQLYLPPSYHRAHFDAPSGRNRLVTLVGDADGALPIPQHVRVSRFVSDLPAQERYHLSSTRNGVYVFVIDGQVTFNGVTLAKRDSAARWGSEAVDFSVGTESSDILFVETIM